jgi:hypothetical protein
MTNQETQGTTNDVDPASVDRVVIRLPERETYLANAILSTLKNWKRHHGARYEGKAYTPPWYVEDCDLKQLEEFAASLWETWQRSEDRAIADGHLIKQQPSKVGSQYA